MPAWNGAILLRWLLTWGAEELLLDSLLEAFGAGSDDASAQATSPLESIPESLPLDVQVQLTAERLVYQEGVARNAVLWLGPESPALIPACDFDFGPGANPR